MLECMRLLAPEKRCSVRNSAGAVSEDFGKADEIGGFGHAGDVDNS